MTKDPKSKAKTISSKKEDIKSDERHYAEFGISSIALNAVTAFSLSTYLGEANLSETIEVIKEKADKVNNGDLKGLENTLTAQTVTLDAMFNKLSMIAITNLDKQHVVEGYLRLALKAQSQCARSIEVLASMRNPPVVFAKQANISHGHQQVNNVTNTHMEEIINQPNELLVKGNYGIEKMDGRATQTAISKDKAVETLGK